MGVVRRFRSWWLMTLAAALLALSWISTALAQQAGGDGDGPDNDELSVLAVVVGVALDGGPDVAVDVALGPALLLPDEQAAAAPTSPVAPAMRRNRRRVA